MPFFWIKFYDLVYVNKRNKVGDTLFGNRANVPLMFILKK